MSVNFYQRFIGDNDSDSDVKRAFQELIDADENDAIEISPEVREDLIVALGKMTQNPQFELMARSLQLRLGARFERFVPPLFRDAAPSPSSIPAADSLIEGLHRNILIDKRAENANSPEKLTIALFVTARQLETIDSDFLRDSGFITVARGHHYRTGGGIRSGMEAGSVGGEDAHFILGDHYNNSHISMKLEFENKSPFPGDPEMTTEQESFVTRKMGVSNGTDVYVVGPGGYGTMDEMLGVLSLMMNGAMVPKDIILLEATKDGGFWKPFFVYMNALIESGAVSPSVRELFHYARDNEDLNQSISYIEQRKRHERETDSDFDSRFTVTHHRQEALQGEMIRHDRTLIEDVFAPLERKRTVSVYGPEGAYDALYANDAKTFLDALEKNPAFEGANILVNADGAFGETARLAGQSLLKSALLSVERAVDPVPEHTPTARSGEVRFYTNPLLNASMMYHSGASVFYPGGIDVHSRLFELMTLMQTQEVKRHRIILVGGREKWGHFLDFVKSLNAYGTISAGDLEYDPVKDTGLFTIVNTTEEAAAFLEAQGFTKKLPETPIKPHKKKSTTEEDYEALYKRELLRRDVDDGEAKEVAHTIVYDRKLNPFVALEHGQELLGAKLGPDAVAALQKRTAIRPNAYDTILAGALAIVKPELARKIISPHPAGEAPTLTGRMATAMLGARAAGLSPTAAVRALAPPATAANVRFPLYPGMINPAGATLPVLPHILSLPGMR